MKLIKDKMTKEERMELDQAFNEETHVFRKFMECFLILVYICYLIRDLVNGKITGPFLALYLLLFILSGIDLCGCFCYRRRIGLAGKDCERWFRVWSCIYGPLLLSWGEYANILEAKAGRPETVFLTVVVLVLCGIRYRPRVQLGLFSISFGVNYALMVTFGDRFLTTEEKLNYLLFFFTVQYVGLLLFRSTVRTLRARKQDHEKAKQLQEVNQELARVNQDLQKAAHTDALTGLGNRLQANQILEECWKADRFFAIAFIDLDHLKFCNDHYGHGEGDHYILALGALLTQLCREEEKLFRIGGDEFLLLSQAAGRAALEKRLEKARTVFAKEAGQEVPYVRSFSYGCAEHRPGAKASYSDLLSEADQCMYQYKVQHRGKWDYQDGRMPR